MIRTWTDPRDKTTWHLNAFPLSIEPYPWRLQFFGDSDFWWIHVPLDVGDRLQDMGGAELGELLDRAKERDAAARLPSARREASSGG